MADRHVPTSYDWLPTYSGGIYCLASWHGAKGWRIASGGSDGDVRIWDATTGQQIVEPLVGHTSAVRALAEWSASDGARLASAGSDGYVSIWKADTYELLLRFPTGSGVRSMTAWQEESGASRVATGNYSGIVRIWDADTAEPVWAPHAAEGVPAVSLAAIVTADGVFLASGDDAGMLSLWNVSTRSLLVPSVRAHAGSVEALLWCSSAEGFPLLVSGGANGVVQAWEVEAGLNPRWSIPGEEPVWSLAAWQEPEDRQALAVGDIGGSIRVLNLETGSLQRTLRFGNAPVTALEGWQDNAGLAHLAAASHDGTIRILQPESDTVLQEVNSGHTMAVWALANWESPSGVRRLASAGLDGIIRIWSSDDGSLVAQASAPHGPGAWALTVAVHDGRPMLFSGSLDGSIQAWDGETAQPQGQPRIAHTAAVSGLACWKSEAGSLGLASVGDDSTVSFWHASDGRSAVNSSAHNGGLLTVVHWTDGSQDRIATAGTDHTVRIWDPETGVQAGPPIVDASSGGIWGMCSWFDEAGAPRIAVGGFDGSVGIWDPVSRARLGALPSPAGPDVRALTSWRSSDGGVRIASSSGNEILVWDPVTCREVGGPLRGHTSSIRTLTAWNTPDGSTRLASAGDDGTIRLWDPDRGLALRTVEVGAITVWGLSDAPATTDLLDRSAMATSLATQIRHSGESGGPDLGGEQRGPAVITLEGPWGSGKSSLMRLIRQQLEDPPGGTPAAIRRPTRRMTVSEALRLLRKPPQDPGQVTDVHLPGAARYVTAWFNPWTHQSGEQVWSGLADCVIEASAPILFPSEAERERYWFTRNLGRMDRRRTARAVLRSLVSPLLGAALLVTVLPLMLSLLQLKSPIPLLGRHLTSASLALAVPCVFLVAGAVHTWVRYHRGWASSFLTRELFEGPLAPGEGPGLTGAPGSTVHLSDPLRYAHKGALYLRQHHVVRLLSDLAGRGFEFVMFIDDLDRCRASTTVEIFEAVNLFLFGLTGSEVRIRFVIGMDPTVVTAHLDQAYQGLQGPGVSSAADDPSIGWAFLRKLSQLPVPIPFVQDTALERFVDAVLGPLTPPAPGPSMPTRRPTPVLPTAGVAGAASAGAQRATLYRTSASARGGLASHRQEPAHVIARHSLEQHPQVQAFLRQRLSQLPERSIREAKRLLNVWQFLIRASQDQRLASGTVEQLAHACRLATLAEIITRWPALQQSLHRRTDGTTGLLKLAAGMESDEQWAQAVQACGATDAVHAPALRRLRHLLLECDGHAVAQLAAEIL